MTAGEDSIPLDDSAKPSSSQSPSDSVSLRTKPDAGPDLYQIEPPHTQPASALPKSISVQEAVDRVQREEEREREEAERKKREEETLDGLSLTDPLVPAKLNRWRQVAAVGGGILLLAFIFAWRATSIKRGDSFAGFAAGLIAVYSAALHACLATAALWLQAKVEQRPMGNWHEALARFFAALSVFQLVVHLPLDTGYEWLSKSLLAIAACAAFFGVVMMLFRWPARRAVMVGGIQVLIYVALSIHIWLGKLIEPK